MKIIKELREKRKNIKHGSYIPIWVIQRAKYVPNIYDEGEWVIADCDGVYEAYSAKYVFDQVYEEATGEKIEDLWNRSLGEWCPPRYFLEELAENIGDGCVFKADKEWYTDLSDGEIFLTLEQARERIPEDNENVRVYCASAWRDKYLRKLDKENNND